METTINEAMALLLNRRSDHQLTAPGPTPEQLQLMLAAASRVPDYHHLRPFRFLIAQGEGRERLGQAMRQAALVGGRPEATVERMSRMPLRAPLIILVVASPKPDPRVPEFEQQLCAASSVLTLQLAARAQGYSGIWRSGWLMYDRWFARLLGLASHEYFVGFLYVGSVAQADETDRQHELPADSLHWL